MVANGEFISTGPLSMTAWVADANEELAATAKLAAANLFVGNVQTIQRDQANAATLLLVTDDESASPGPIMTLRRTSASPVANDKGGQISWQMSDSGGNLTTVGQLEANWRDPTNASEDAQIRLVLMTAGSLTGQIQISDGVTLGSPTGSFKGLGTLNAVEVYDDNVLLTDMVQEAVARKDGKIDVNFWHGQVSDIEVPEEEFEEAELEEAEANIIVVENGKAVLRRQTVVVERQEVLQVFHEDGSPVLAKGKDGKPVQIEARRPVMKTTKQPARLIKRKHLGATVLQAMMDQGFKPWDRQNVIKWFQETQTLPGMLSQQEWDEAKKPSIGEMTTRSWMAKEIMMCCLCQLSDDFDQLEQRVQALEAFSQKSRSGRKPRATGT